MSGWWAPGQKAVPAPSQEILAATGGRAAMNACGAGAASNQITFTQPDLATSSAR